MPPDVRPALFSNKTRIVQAHPFTLLEVLLAVMILSLVLSCVYVTADQTVTGVERIRTGADRLQMRQIITSIIRQDLRNLISSDSSNEQAPVQWSEKSENGDTEGFQLIVLTRPRLSGESARRPCRVRYFLRQADQADCPALPLESPSEPSDTYLFRSTELYASLEENTQTEAPPSEPICAAKEFQVSGWTDDQSEEANSQRDANWSRIRLKITLGDDSVIELIQVLPKSDSNMQE